MLAFHSTGAVCRALDAREMANQHVRFRDLKTDHVHLTENGKDIDIFTEHVVEMQVRRRLVRICDAVRCLDVEVAAWRVRDVDRRCARVTDNESVMNVLTEHVKVADVVQNSWRAQHGVVSWTADAQEVHYNETKEERVEFGELPTEPEPVVTLPEEEEEEAPAPEETTPEEQRVVFEELEDEDEDVVMTEVNANVTDRLDDVLTTNTAAEVDCNNNDIKSSNTNKDDIPSERCTSDQLDNEYNQAKGDLHQPPTAEQLDNQYGEVKMRPKPPLERKLSRRNRSGSLGFIDLKPARRPRSFVRSSKAPLRRHQSAALIT